MYECYCYCCCNYCCFFDIYCNCHCQLILLFLLLLLRDHVFAIATHCHLYWCWCRMQLSPLLSPLIIVGNVILQNNHTFSAAMSTSAAATHSEQMQYFLLSLRYNFTTLREVLYLIILLFLVLFWKILVQLSIHCNDDCVVLSRS